MAYTFLNTYTGVCKNVLGGTITNSTFKVDVYYEQNINNNTTSLKIQPYVTKSGHGESVTWYFKVDGNDYYSVFCNTYVNSRVDGGTAYKTVTHNNDGTCTFTLNVSVETSYTQGANANLNNACMKWGTLSTSVTLPTIPRASSFTVPTFTCGSAGTIKISRASSSFTHKVLYAFGSVSGTISSSATTSCSWTPDNSLAQQIPNSLSGVGTITVETYNGSTKIGSSSKSFTLHVSGSMYPTIGSLTLSGVNLWNGYYVKNYSQVKATINNPSGSYGSTIASYSLNGNNLSSTTSSATSSKLQVVGTNTYTATVYDSRGRSATKTGSIYVQDYYTPSVTNIMVYRCTSNGVANNEGTYINVSCDISVTNIANANLNAKTITVKTRAIGETSWVTKVSNLTLERYSGTYSSGALSSYTITKAFEVQIILSDSFSSVTHNASVPVASCIMNVEEGGVGIGKYHEKGALDVGGDAYVSGDIYSGGHKVPVIKANDGVMEVGQSIDMHHGNFSNDYDARFEVTNGRALMIHTPNGEVSLSNADAGGSPKRFMNLYTRGLNDCAISNSLTGHYLQLLDNGWLDYTGGMQLNRLGIKDMRDISPAPNSYASYQATLEFKDYVSSGINTQSVHWSNVLTTKGWGGDDGSHPISQLAFNGPSVYYRCSNGSNGWRGWNRLAQYKHLNGYWGMAVDLDGDATWIRTTSPGLIPHSSGGNSSSLGTQSWMFKEVHGKTLYMANSRCFWATNTTDIMTNSSILPETNGTRCLGYTNNRWAGVYAANGTIQTSDMRYKSDIKDVDNETFFNMIKGTGVHTYVLNENRVDAKDVKPLTEDTAPQENIHLGILAQELAEFEGSNYILNYDEESGYSINNYNLTSAVMAALKAEISKREKAEERLAQAEEHIKVLEDRLEKIEALLELK